jgi:hypothetical protein
MYRCCVVTGQWLTPGVQERAVPEVCTSKMQTRSEAGVEREGEPPTLWRRLEVIPDQCEGVGKDTGGDWDWGSLAEGRGLRNGGVSRERVGRWKQYGPLCGCSRQTSTVVVMVDVSNVSHKNHDTLPALGGASGSRLSWCRRWLWVWLFCFSLVEKVE